ncbi:venom allergen 5-like isoform X2 [Aethina tumida]|uniref:venom allergen 5-like isoform X2 n=1 Tax=Aethina tumida TaxID=116153 RepID=UPI00214894B5|nr:venom allergen 5-like isoform X2 [Aethina tumida]
MTYLNIRLIIIHIFVCFGAVYDPIKVTDFCDFPCEKAQDKNFLCKMGTECEVVENCEYRPLDDKFRLSILEKHNQLRNMFPDDLERRGYKPKPSNMRALSWDLGLEFVATCEVRMCEIKKLFCKTTRRFDNSAQNEADKQNLTSTDEYFTDDHILSLIQEWYDQINIVFDNKLESIFVQFHEIPQKYFSDFTQIVWARTSHVGCAMSHHFVNKIFFLVCLYGRTGNREGQPVFRPGSPCEGCVGVKCNEVYTNLCGPIEPINIDDMHGSNSKKVSMEYTFVTFVIGFNVISFY